MNTDSADAELAAFRAINEKEIYPFHKKPFIRGFLAGRKTGRCIHCDPTFVPEGPDDYCYCKCHVKELGF